MSDLLLNSRTIFKSLQFCNIDSAVWFNYTTDVTQTSKMWGITLLVKSHFYWTVPTAALKIQLQISFSGLLRGVLSFCNNQTVWFSSHCELVFDSMWHFNSSGRFCWAVVLTLLNHFADMFCWAVVLTMLNHFADIS